jgi:hypothetical protein
MTILNFDARQVAPATGQMDPVPNGWYILAMTKSGEKPTRNGDANYLEVEYTILDGPHKDRKVFENFNLWHPTNVQAKEIAWREMSALCHATGRIQVGDTSELHNIPFKGKIRIKPGEGDYGPKNEVMAYRAINDPQPVDHGVKGVGAPAHGAPAAFTPPPAAAPQAAWGPPAAPQQPQQPWQQPQAQQPAPQQPQQPQGAPAAMPAWTPPAGAAPQPWAAQPPAAAPVAAPAVPPANMPPAWAPPPVAAPQGGAPIAPPWQR